MFKWAPIIKTLLKSKPALNLSSNPSSFLCLAAATQAICAGRQASTATASGGRYGRGDGIGEAAEKYAVHELAGVVPGLSIADAVASLYDMALTGKGIDAKPLQKQTQTEPAVVEASYVDYEDEDKEERNAFSGYFTTSFNDLARQNDAKRSSINNAY
jgi:hypothetical protein